MNKTRDLASLSCFYSNDKSKIEFINSIPDFKYKCEFYKISRLNISKLSNSYLCNILFLDLPENRFLTEIIKSSKKKLVIGGIASNEEEIYKFHNLGIVNVLINTRQDSFIKEQLSLLLRIFEKEQDLNTLSKDLEHQHRLYIAQVNKVKSLSSVVDEPVLFINKNNQIIFCNRKAQHVFGYTKYEIINEDIFQWIVAPRSKDILINIIESITTNNALRIKDNVNIFVRNKLGVEFEMNTSITQHKIKSNEYSVVFVFHDIQKLKKLEREQLRNRELWEETKILKEFIHQISHDLKTPMNSIIGLAKTIQKYNADNLTERQQEGLSIIEESGKQLVTLISDILDISRMDKNKLELNYDRFSVSKHLSLQKSQALQLIDKNSVKFLVKKSSSVPDILYGDQRKIFQVVNNLVGNAIKFTNRGKIVLSCYYYDNKLFFEVSDTGIGIRKEKQREIFEKFRQADSSFNKIGTGLGLYISKKLVEMMHGEIYLESEFEKGSLFRFYVSLPEFPEKYKQRNISTEHNELEIISYNPGNRLILAIDDNYHNKFIYKLLAEKDNYNILLAKNGKSGLHAVKRYYPDIIILKMEIPEIHGETILKEIIKNQAQIPVVVATDYNLSNLISSKNVYTTEETLEYDKLNKLLSGFPIGLKKSTINTMVIFDDDSWINKLKKTTKQFSYVKNDNPELTYILLNQIPIKNLIIEQLTRSSNALILTLKLLSDSSTWNIENIWLHYEGTPLNLINKKIENRNNVLIYSRVELEELLIESSIIEE